MTTLDWDGPGSFYEAMTATEPRIIVFRVAGEIKVPSNVSLTEANSYVTVAGQTSPGGITLTGSSTFIRSYRANFHDGVFRFLRFRGRDNSDGISFNEAHDMVWDHCDFSGATDECFDVTRAYNVTLQWCTIMNSQPSLGGKGALVAYAPTAQISMHHNLWAHHDRRFFPHMHWGDGDVPEPGAVIEFSNNVGYNCAFEAAMLNAAVEAPERLFFNVVGNYVKPGPDTPPNSYAFGLSDGTRTYAADNAYPGMSVWSPWRDLAMLDARVPAPPITYHPSSDVWDVVLRKAGAWPRDPMNARVVGEAENGTGTLENLDDPILSTSWEPPADADLDGMPDDWETERGLDPNDPDDASLDRDGDGYTNIEEYVNGVAAFLIPD